MAFELQNNVTLDSVVKCFFKMKQGTLKMRQKTDRE